MSTQAYPNFHQPGIPCVDPESVVPYQSVTSSMNSYAWGDQFHHGAVAGGFRD